MPIVVSSEKGVVLGAREFLDAIKVLPARVAQKVMDEWTLSKAKEMAKLARSTAPRGKKHRGPESARLYRSIVASRVKNIKKFPGSVSRSIAYSAKPRGTTRTIERINRAIALRAARGYTGRKRVTPITKADMPQKARHFHLYVRGTRDRVRKSGGRTGVMPARPAFWDAAARTVLAHAAGEVGSQLRNAYITALDREMKRITKRYS